MEDNNLRAHPAGAAKSANTALPAQEKERDEAERAYLEELVERAVEAKLHNYPLPGRRFSKRAYKLAREAFKTAAWNVVDGICPQLRLNGRDLRRLAKLRIGNIPEGTISSDITLLNDLAETEEGRVGFLSPVINTTRGLRQVRLFLLSERTDHFFSFAVLDERGKVLVKRITAEVEPGQTFEDMMVAEVLRSSRVQLRLMKVLKISAAVLTACILTYAVLPKEAQAAVRKFGREKIVEPLRRLFGGGEVTPAGSNVDVPAGRDIPNARIVEERARLRLTPSMHWSYGGVANSGAFCRGNTPINLVSMGPAEIDPPFVVVRNNVIIRDNVRVKKVAFEDRDIQPGRSYTYALGKRDPATGEVMIGPMVGTTVPRCPISSLAGNRPPALALTVDRATGPAPLRATFNVSVFDDEARVRPFVFDFGDGTYMLPSNSPKVTHEYRYGGTYTAKVFYSDPADQRAEGLTSVSVEGPPPPPPLTRGAQNPWEQWHGDLPFAKASPVVGYVDDPFTIEILPQYMIRSRPNVPVASYYWSFSDCFGGPRDPVALKDNKTNCFVGPFKEPQITRRFDKPGTYWVDVYMVFEDGDTASYRLGAVTAIPSERWLAAHQVDARTRMYYDQMIEAARYYPSKYPDLTTPP